jgi:hypothetical protein
MFVPERSPAAQGLFVPYCHRRAPISGAFAYRWTVVMLSIVQQNGLPIYVQPVYTHIRQLANNCKQKT